MSLLEAGAFVVSIVGVWLTTTRSLWNYPFSILSVALYGALFYNAKLYADMGLQGIFACALFYGLWQWTRGRNIESWWMWIVVDIFYVGMYGFKHLYLLAVLYAFFVALAALGLRRWQVALAHQGP
jgi:nicotinamide riboside transporter PnuC